MNVYSKNIQLDILSKNISYKIFQFTIKSEDIIFENKIEKHASKDASIDDSIDLALRSDNVLLMSHVNIVLECTASLTDGAYTVANYLKRNYVYNMCLGTCFMVDLSANMSLTAVALWYKKNKTSRMDEKLLCSSQLIKFDVLAESNYFKQICKDNFMREGNYNINMLYANCNQEYKPNELTIDIQIMYVHVVEIAVYNKWSIEHLPLKCINKKSIKDSTINSKKLQTIPWNLIVDVIHHEDMPKDKSFKEFYNNVSKGITDNNTYSCFLFNFNRRIVLFTFEFNGLVLMKSITFITGISLENNALFKINQYSNTADSPYQKKLNNINECNKKVVKDMTISYNG